MSPSAGRSGRRGCCLLGGGCLALIAMVVCLAGGAVVALPAIVAYFRPDADILYGSAPDPAATAHLNRLFADAELDGVTAYVIPITGGTGQIAIITLDESAGFQGTGEAGFDALVHDLAQANQDGDYNITRVALDYRDPEGNDLLAVTVDQASLEAYASGQITRRELLASTEADLSNLIAALQVYSEGEGAP